MKKHQKIDKKKLFEKHQELCKKDSTTNIYSGRMTRLSMGKILKTLPKVDILSSEKYDVYFKDNSTLYLSEDIYYVLDKETRKIEIIKESYAERKSIRETLRNIENNKQEPPLTIVMQE